ncbi:MAG: hypothetical protein M3033_03615 [Acidobacteriota bacterium]|nr:hypothetical protein [Acidobacteriota bacterium]
MKIMQSPNYLRVFFQMLLCCAFLTNVCFGQETSSEPAATSRLAGIKLPAKTERITDKSVIEDLRSQLKQIVAKWGGTAENIELLGWEKPDVAAIKVSIAKAMKAAGYEYEAQEVEAEGKKWTVIGASKATDAGGKLVVVGFFVAQSADILLLGWTDIKVAPTAQTSGGANNKGNDSPNSAVPEAATLKMPTFPKIAAKPNQATGVVLNMLGNRFITDNSDPVFFGPRWEDFPEGNGGDPNESVYKKRSRKSGAGSIVMEIAHF